MAESCALVESHLNGLVADSDKAEAKLTGWADKTVAAVEAQAHDLRARADQEAQAVASAAAAMERRYDSMAAAAHDDTGALDRLLASLGEHSAAAARYGQSASEASALASKSMDEARARFDLAASGLVATVAAHRAGMADGALLQELAEAAKAVSEAASRQEAVLALEREELAATKTELLQLVEEQKASHLGLVDAVKAKVAEELDKQSASVLAKLDLAAAGLLARHASMTGHNTKLSGDVGKACGEMRARMDKAGSTVEVWAGSDKAQANAMDDSVRVLKAAAEAVRPPPLLSS